MSDERTASEIKHRVSSRADTDTRDELADLCDVVQSLAARVAKLEASAIRAATVKLRPEPPKPTAEEAFERVERCLDDEQMAAVFDSLAIVRAALASVAQLQKSLDGYKTELAAKQLDRDEYKAKWRVHQDAACTGVGYWAWQGDGTDHLESLTCPVLIRPSVLQAILAQRAAPDSHEAEPAIVTERWQCEVCGTPCRVEIEKQLTLYPEVNDKPVFRPRRCLCDDEDTPVWKRLDDLDTAPRGEASASVALNQGDAGTVVCEPEIWPDAEFMPEAMGPRVRVHRWEDNPHASLDLLPDLSWSEIIMHWWPTLHEAHAALATARRLESERQKGGAK